MAAPAERSAQMSSDDDEKGLQHIKAKKQHIDITIILSLEDLHEVLKILKKHNYISTDYFSLGLSLGLLYSTIDAIKVQYRGDTQSCLRECLVKWLQKVDKVEEKGGPTIKSLMAALKEHQNAVADKIHEEKHPACEILNRYVNNPSLEIVLPQLTVILHDEKLIRKIKLPPSGQAQVNVLLSEIKEAVCNDYHKLEKLAKMLCDMTETAEVGNAIIKEYNKVFCSNDAIDADEGLEIHIPQEIILKFVEMRLKFGEIFAKVESEVLDEKTFCFMKRILTYSFESLKSQLQDVENIGDILELISHNCSLNEITMLKFFVTTLNLPKAQNDVQEYNDAIKKLYKILSQFLIENISPRQRPENVTVVTDHDNKDITKDIRKLSKNALSECKKLYVTIRGQSFTITCSFPLFVTQEQIAIAKENIELLNDENVTIEYCDINEAKEIVDNTLRIDSLSAEQKPVTVYACSGTMEKLMLSLSVQLLHSKDEMNTLNEKMLTMRMEAVSMKKSLDIMEKSLEDKSRILKMRTIENERLRKDTDEAKKLLQKIIKQEAENETLKKIIHLMEEQLVLFQSEKKEQEMSGKKSDEWLLGKEEIQKLMAEKKKEIKMLQETSTLHEIEMRENEKILSQEFNLKNKVLLCENSTISFKDDVYGMIVIDHPLIVKIIGTHQFQRLKDIKRLEYTGHSTSYSRLQHSIGMCYLAGKFVKQLKKRQPELGITDYDVLCVRVAALCYNMGHGPFSDTFGMEISKASKGVSEVSVEIFEYMIKENEILLTDLNDSEKDITFIKDLIKGEGHHKGKEFLYEIIVNKSSGLDVRMLDLITHDANVLGMNIDFKWRVFITKARVREFPAGSGELHICVQEDDLETYNDLFSTRHKIYRELYYERKNRVVAAMIKRILQKSSERRIISDKDGKITIVEAMQSMPTFTQLTDGVLSLIKSSVVDPEVQVLLGSLDSLKLIAQIGYVTPEEGWSTDDMKHYIIEATNDGDIADYLLIDPIKSGYEKHESRQQYYYRKDGSTGKWDHKWARPPHNDLFKPPWRVFLVSGNKKIVQSTQDALKEVIKKKNLSGRVYPDKDNADLMPPSN